MAKSLSVDLRVRVLAANDAGLSRRRAAARFGVSAASAIRWCAQRARTGVIAPKPQGGDRRSARTQAHAAKIHSLVAAEPDLTLAELRTRLAADGIATSSAALWRFFRRHQITLKKRPAMRPSRSGPMC